MGGKRRWLWRCRGGYWGENGDAPDKRDAAQTIGGKALMVLEMSPGLLGENGDALDRPASPRLWGENGDDTRDVAMAIGGKRRCPRQKRRCPSYGGKTAMALEMPRRLLGENGDALDKHDVAKTIRGKTAMVLEMSPGLLGENGDALDKPASPRPLGENGDGNRDVAIAIDGKR